VRSGRRPNWNVLTPLFSDQSSIEESSNPYFLLAKTIYNQKSISINQWFKLVRKLREDVPAEQLINILKNEE
jgi:hypothetical protein